jgi:hypothetical protein
MGVSTLNAVKPSVIIPSVVAPQSNPSNENKVKQIDSQHLIERKNSQKFANFKVKS